MIRFAVIAVALALGSGPALAFSDGIFGTVTPGHSNPGCSCHGSAELASTTTRLRIEGLPEAYRPREAYEIDVYVLGIPLVGVGTSQTHDRLAGFNLEVSAGRLESLAGDASVRTQDLSECHFRKLSAFPTCSVGNDCGVVGDDPCLTRAECASRKCRTPGVGDCRPCDDTTPIAAEAAHHDEGSYGLVPDVEALVPEYFDGNSRFRWRLRWIAPDAGRGSVLFYLAGNVVNGNHAADETDMWSMLGNGPLQDPVIVVSEGSH